MVPQRLIGSSCTGLLKQTPKRAGFARAVEESSAGRDAVRKF